MEETVNDTKHRCGRASDVAWNVRILLTFGRHGSDRKPERFCMMGWSLVRPKVDDVDGCERGTIV